MSAEPSAVHFVDVNTNIIQEVIEIQPVSTDASQSEDTVGPDMPSGGWGEPGGISLQRLNLQSSARVPPDQDLAIEPLAPQNFLKVPPSSTHINTNTSIRRNNKTGRNLGAIVQAVVLLEFRIIPQIKTFLAPETNEKTQIIPYQLRH